MRNAPSAVGAIKQTQGLGKVPYRWKRRGKTLREISSFAATRIAWWQRMPVSLDSARLLTLSNGSAVSEHQASFVISALAQVSLVSYVLWYCGDVLRREVGLSPPQTHPVPCTAPQS